MKNILKKMKALAVAGRVMVPGALCLVLGGGLALGAFAETLPDYTIVLTNGVAYKSTDNGKTLGDTITPEGLSYAGGVWTMNGFNFKTTAPTAVMIAGTNDAVTVTVTGDNSIAGGDSVQTVGGLYIESATKFQGGGTLTVTSGSNTTMRSSCAMSAHNDIEIDGITLTVNAGCSPKDDSYAVYLGYGYTFTVNNATCALNGGSGASSSGIYCDFSPEDESMSHDESTSHDEIVVLGTGKITAKAGNATDEMYGVEANKEPRATARDASGNELTWLDGGEEEQGTYKDTAGNIATYVIMTAKAPPVQIPSKPTEVANTTYAVYTNGVLSADGTVWSNGVATVVYTAVPGWCFKTGATVATNTLDTSVSPAVNKAGEVVPKLGKPVVMLGKVAQRYPWNGMLDIQYKTQYANASCKVTFYVDGAKLGTASGTGGQIATASFDLNTAAGGAFKEKSLKNVKIVATIE